MSLPWNDDYVVDLRGSESTDPTADGLDVTVAMAGVLPIRKIFGEIVETGTRTLHGRSEARIELACVPKPFSVLANVYPEMQDYGICWQLQKVLAHTFIHVLAVRKVGSDPGAGAIPRARLDADTGDTDNLFWTTEITLPMTTVLDGDAIPQPNFDDGTVAMSYTLVKITPEDNP